MRCEAPYQFLCYRNPPKAKRQPAFLLHLLDISSTLAPNFLRHYDRLFVPTFVRRLLAFRNAFPTAKERMVTYVLVVGTPPLYVVAHAITAPSFAPTKLISCGPFHPDKSESAPFNSTSSHHACPIGRPRKLALYRPVTEHIPLGPRRCKDKLYLS
jgi:hypothetical protein